MMRTTNNRKTRTAGPGNRTVICALAAIVALVFLGPVTMARAEDPVSETPQAYQPAKTVADYTEGAAKADAGDFDYADNSLRVEVWVDKAQGDVYRRGEAISVGVQTNQDAYAVVYRIDTEGLVSVLWPRTRFDDGFIFGGHEYALPVSGAARLRVSDQEGEGLVEAIVSRYPFDLRALELDFHHEHKTERYDFRVAGDPFLAMNEVNYAVTGLEDSGEYVVTNYASYYVHQKVDHPRYLCSQCHIEDDVTYDPYRDECTLDIEPDYSWYNSWYDSYGYYPVYGNPVYVYIDPWTWNPWVNYWYSPAYTCAPWYGWGWGWGASYNWRYSPYYWGDCSVAYGDGYRRYRPLDRTRLTPAGGTATKTREYVRGSAMVRKGSLSGADRSAMTKGTRRDRTDRAGAIVAGRSGGKNGRYRGADLKIRNRQHFDQVATRGSNRGVLRIRDTRRGDGAVRGRTIDSGAGKRHTAAGKGQRAGLVPVSRGSSLSNETWRGTTRVGGGTTLGNSRRSAGAAGSGATATSRARSRESTSGKAVQPRKRSTRVWNATGARSGSRKGGGRSRSETVSPRTRRVQDRDRGPAVKPSAPSKNKSTRQRSAPRVKPQTNSNRGGKSTSGGATRSGKSGGSSRSKANGQTRGGTGSRGGGSRR